MTTSFEHTPGPWDIVWFICRMDEKDVLHARAGGNETAKAGDEMWRVPLKIGPLSAEHCHWAGTHLDCRENDAHLIAAAPDLLEALREITADYAERFDLGDTSTNPGIKASISAAHAAIAKATGGRA